MKIASLLLFLSFLFGTDVPFKVGETLRYNASFSGIDAATGKLEVLGKKTIHSIDTYHVRFSATTHGFTDILFPIRDVIDLWLDVETLLPVKVVKNINEGSYKKKNSIHLNQAESFALYKKDTISIKTGTHSPYSLFYFFRRGDLSKIHGKTFSTIDGRKKTQLQMTVEENVEASVPIGDFMCTKVTPMRTDKKKFKNEATMSIWFSNDENRYPVKIWIKMKFGAFVLKLDKVIN